MSGTTWFNETVDSTGKQEVWAGRGTTSLELDQADMPYIIYYDVTHGDLKFARFDGKVWIIQAVDSGGGVGSYSSLALDTVGCPHISYHDLTNVDLKYAYINYPTSRAAPPQCPHLTHFRTKPSDTVGPVCGTCLWSAFEVGW